MSSFALSCVLHKQKLVNRSDLFEDYTNESMLSVYLTYLSREDKACSRCNIMFILFITLSPARKCNRLRPFFPFSIPISFMHWTHKHLYYINIFMFILMNNDLSTNMKIQNIEHTFLCIKHTHTHTIDNILNTYFYTY